MWPLSRAKKRQQQSRPIVEVEKQSKPVLKRPVKLLMDLRPEAQRKRSPGPSLIWYRVARGWKKAWVRHSALVLLPLALLVFGAWRTATDPVVQEWYLDQRDALIASLASRPEFVLTGYTITGASREVAERIDSVVDLPPDASTLTYDVTDLQRRIGDLPEIARARAVIGTDGMLEISIHERIATVLWRDQEDVLWRVDTAGVAIGEASARNEHPDLPLLIGAGAQARVAEALDVFAAAPALHPRLRAIVRVGERRWDVVLDRGLTIQLPENEPSAVLARVMAWQFGDEILDRGLSAIDMRLPERPTLRMAPKAHEIWRLRDSFEDAGEET